VPTDQLILLNAVAISLLLAGIFVYRKMLRRVATRCPPLRSAAV